MGDIADMMLDGTLCEGCGVYMEGGNGYPQRCADCVADSNKPKKRCKHCRKQVQQHQTYCGAHCRRQAKEKRRRQRKQSGGLLE